MVVVDRFSTMTHFIALEQNATAKDVANVFLREVWKLHCYGGSNILKTSGYTRPVRLRVWRIRLGRQSNKSEGKR